MLIAMPDTYRVTADPVLLAAGIWLAQHRAAAGHLRASAASATRMGLVKVTALEVGSSWPAERDYRAYLAAVHLDPALASAALALREDALRTPNERRKAGTTTSRQKGLGDGHAGWRDRLAALDASAHTLTIVSTQAVVPDRLATEAYRAAVHRDVQASSRRQDLPADVLARSNAYISIRAVERSLNNVHDGRTIMVDQILALLAFCRVGLRLRLLPATAPMPRSPCVITEYRVRLPEHQTGGRIVATSQHADRAYYHSRAEHDTVSALITGADQVALSTQDSRTYLTQRLADLRATTPTATRGHATVASTRTMTRKQLPGGGSTPAAARLPQPAVSLAGTTGPPADPATETR